MKKLFGSSRAVVLAGGVVVLAITLLAAACKTTGPAGGAISWGHVRILHNVQADQVVLFAPTLTSEERTKFDSILATSKQHLYKVVTFKNGKKGPTRGTLDEMTAGGTSYTELMQRAEIDKVSGNVWLCDGNAGSGGGHASVAPPVGDPSAKPFVDKVEKALAKYVER